MYFLNPDFINISIVLFYLTVCGSSIKCEEYRNFNETLPILTKANEKLDNRLECNTVFNNETIKHSHSVRFGPGKDKGCGLDGCVGGAGTLLGGEGLLQGLFRLVYVCGLRTECYRRRLLIALDRALDSDTLRLADGVYMVKEYRHEQRLESGASDSEPFLTAFTRRLVTLLETRALRVRLGVMKDTVSQTRGFHRGYRHAFPMMVGSFMLLAAFTVPMGFQFLAVIGGKALILSQIALFLALGGHLQRYLGWGAAPPAGGFVQHDYFLRDDLRPWHREGSDGEILPLPQRQQQAYISNQQLQGYMNQRVY